MNNVISAAPIIIVVSRDLHLGWNRAAQIALDWSHAPVAFWDSLSISE